MATYSGSYIMGNIGRIGTLLYATIGWTDNAAPSTSATPYQLFDCYSSVLSAENVRKAQVAYINLAEYPFNLVDSLGINFKIEVNGSALFSTEYIGPSLIYNSNHWISRRVAHFESGKTLSDLQTAFGGTGTSYRKSFAYEIRFIYYPDAILASSGKTALVNPNSRVIYQKRVEFSSGVYIRAASGTTAGSNTPVYAPSGTPTPTITETDGIKDYLAEKFSAFLVDFGALKTNALNAANYASSAKSVVQNTTYGNSAIKTAVNAIASTIGEFGSGSGPGAQYPTLADMVDSVADDVVALSAKVGTPLSGSTVADDVTSILATVADQNNGVAAIKSGVDTLTADHSTVMYYVSDTRSKVTDIKTAIDGHDVSGGGTTVHVPGISENAAAAATSAATAATQSTAAASSAANAAQDAATARLWVTDPDTGLHAIAADASSAATAATAASNAVSNVTYGNSAIKTALDSVASNVSAATTAVTSVSWGNSAIKEDTAAIRSTVTSGTYGNSAIKTAVDSVGSNLGTFGTGSGLGSDVSDAREALDVIAERIGTPDAGTSVAADTAAIRAAVMDEDAGISAVSDAVDAVQASVNSIASTIGTPAGESLAADIGELTATALDNADAISHNGSRISGLIHAVEKNTSETHQLKREVKK